MNKAIIGKKLGMTQIFTPDGLVVPVTVVEAGPCTVVQKKTVAKEGYNSLVVAFDETKESRVNKAQMGAFKKANVSAHRILRELKLDDVSAYEIGKPILCDIFNEKDKVDVVGLTRGSTEITFTARNGYSITINVKVVEQPKVEQPAQEKQPVEPAQDDNKDNQ